MTKLKVQSARSLMDEMRAVARGEKHAPKDAGKVSFNSVEAIVRLLTPENRSKRPFGVGCMIDSRQP